jgi:hypothetical protein
MTDERDRVVELVILGSAALVYDVAVRGLIPRIQ